MHEKPSQWLKRELEKEPEQLDGSDDSVNEHPQTEEPAPLETRAEYRSQLRHMVEQVLATQRDATSSPDPELGEAVS